MGLALFHLLRPLLDRYLTGGPGDARDENAPAAALTPAPSPGGRGEMK